MSAKSAASAADERCETLTAVFRFRVPSYGRKEAFENVLELLRFRASRAPVPFDGANLRLASKAYPIMKLFIERSPTIETLGSLGLNDALRDYRPPTPVSAPRAKRSYNAGKITRLDKDFL